MPHFYKIWIVILAISFTIPTYALAPQETKESLKQLSFEDWHDVSNDVLKKSLDTASETGYVKYAGIGGEGGFLMLFPQGSLNQVNSTQSGDIGTLYGGAGGFSIALTQDWSIGGYFGGFGGEKTQKVNTNFHTFQVSNAFQMALLRYKPWIDPSWILELDAGLGLGEGSYAELITDESSISKTTTRSQIGLAGLMNIGIRYRINPVWYVGTKVGFFFEKLTDLQRGDYTQTGSNLDFSSSYIQLLMGGNI